MISLIVKFLDYMIHREPRYYRSKFNDNYTYMPLWNTIRYRLTRNSGSYQARHVLVMKTKVKGVYDSSK